jgi:hypothetical protein
MLVDKLRTVARTGRRSSAAFAEEALHDAILKTVESDDGEPPTGSERALGRLKSLLKLVELGVEVNSDRLKGPRRRIRLLARTKTRSTANDCGKLGCPLYRACANDCTGDRPGARLLPIVAQNPGDLGLPGRIQEISGS